MGDRSLGHLLIAAHERDCEGKTPKKTLELLLLLWAPSKSRFQVSLVARCSKYPAKSRMFHIGALVAMRHMTGLRPDG